MSKIIKKITRGMPKILYLIEDIISKSNNDIILLVRPQPGQGIVVSILNKQGIRTFKMTIK